MEEGEFSVYRLPNRATSAVSVRVIDCKEGGFKRYHRPEAFSELKRLLNIILKYSNSHSENYLQGKIVKGVVLILLSYF